MGKLTNLNDFSTQYLPLNPRGLKFGHDEFNVIDFHVKQSPPSINYDGRIIASEGIGQNGKCNLAIQVGLLSLLCNVAISGTLQANGGAKLARLLVAPTYIDLPSIPAGGIYDIYMSVPGVLVGDLAFFVPTAELYNGLWTVQIQAAITNNNTARVYFHNLYPSAVDIAPFAGKLLVLGFSS
jgi:hypothetical protein